MDSNQLVGMAADIFSKTGPLFSGLRSVPARRKPAGVLLQPRKNPTLLARAFPVLNRNNVVAGVLLVLEERRRTIALHGKSAVPAKDPFGCILGDSQALQTAVSTARRMAAVSTTVLITGGALA